MLDLEKKEIQARIKILKHLKNKEFYAAIQIDFLRTPVNEIYQRCTKRLYGSRQTERILKDMVQLESAEIFTVKRKKEVYYKITKKGHEQLKIYIKFIKQDYEAVKSYYEELLAGT
ncbi:hypothetical protein K8R33_02810 [archaeon]|nr:hypothetical protein [archaeon]